MGRQIGAVKTQVPLCVSAYDNILEWVDAAGLVAGDRFPGEIELAEQLGVSRSVVREALLLLEEDGYVIRHRGKPRTLASRTYARVGFDAPITAMLSTEKPLEPARRLQAHMYHAFPPVHEIFGVGGDGLLWETTFAMDGAEVCSSLEWGPAAALTPELRESATNGAPLDRYPGAMLEAIIRPRSLSVLQWRFAPISVASQRAGCLDFGPSSVPVGLTVALGAGGQLLYYAKHVFDLAVATVAIEPALSVGE